MLETTWYWFRDSVTFSQVVIFVHTHCQVLNQKWPRHMSLKVLPASHQGSLIILPQRDPSLQARPARV